MGIFEIVRTIKKILIPRTYIAKHLVSPVLTLINDPPEYGL